jgi:SSS family solute:Na+ symporter
MALNFYGAIWAFGTCFVVTVIVSLATRRTKNDEELKGLVYSLTPKVKEHGVPWYRQPATLAIVVLVATLLLNFLFW